MPITGTAQGAATRVLEFPLPAGNFAVTSKVNVVLGRRRTGSSTASRRPSRDGTTWVVASIGPNAGESLESTLATTFTAQGVAGLLYIDCWRVNGTGAAPRAGLAEAVAVQVGAVTTFTRP